MEELEHLEAGLAEFEHLTGQPLTILGLDGIFDFRQARRLFTPQRASHKKIGACAAIFSEHCIEHCRHRQSRLCREAAGPFVSECPFGIRQLVFPLREQLVHYGMLFLGAWRSEAGSGAELLERIRLPVTSQSQVNMSVSSDVLATRDYVDRKCARKLTSWTLENDITAEGSLSLPEGWKYVVGKAQLLLFWEGQLLDGSTYAENGDEGTTSQSVTLHFSAARGDTMQLMLFDTTL